jgi:acyl carrier protein
MADTGEVLQTIQVFLGRVKKGVEIDTTTSLFGDGLGLDSLETAELSALLEDEHGTDPFSSGGVPQCIDEILAFYAVKAA